MPVIMIYEEDEKRAENKILILFTYLKVPKRRHRTKKAIYKNLNNVLYRLTRSYLFSHD